VSSAWGYSGFDFMNEAKANHSNGSPFIITTDSKKVVISVLQENGGVVNIGKGSLSNVGSAPTDGYESYKFVELKVGYNYAIYDEENDNYGIIHINSIRVDQ